MKRLVVLSLVLLALLAIPILAVVPTTAQTEKYTLTLTIIGADNKPLSLAVVELYDTNGTRVDVETTDVDGVAVFENLTNGSYLVVAKPGYVILTVVTVAGNTSIIVNASAMHHVNLSSTPISVPVDVDVAGFEEADLGISTNMTIYSDVNLNVTFPSEVKRLPWKYVFEKAVVDGAEVNTTKISLDMASDHSVIVYYTKTFAVTMSLWMVLLLVLAIIIAIVVALKLGSKTAKAVIMDIRMKSRRFVKKKSI